MNMFMRNLIKRDEENEETKYEEIEEVYNTPSSTYRPKPVEELTKTKSIPKREAPKQIYVKKASLQ